MLVGARMATSPLPAATSAPGSAQKPILEGPGGSERSAADDFGRPLDSWLPGPIRLAWGAIEGAVRKGVDLLAPEEAATPDGAGITAPLDRAREAQRALVDEHAMIGNQDRFHNEGLEVWRTETWPLGQVLHGRIILAMEGGDWNRVDAIFRELESYRVGDGFAGGAGESNRYYDDNEWIGLAAMQAYHATGDAKYLRHAERTFRMVETGAHPDGGMYWLEQDRVARHTCSVAPAAQLALQLHEATGEQKYLRFASDQASWLNDHLRLESGLYADKLTDTGELDPTVYSYNQGTPIGLDVQLYRATGDHRFLDRARRTADAALAYFGTDDRLWKQAPVFNTIFFRNLLALHAAAPDPRYVATLDGYLDRLWKEARNPETGLFDQGGAGHYGENAGHVIDQGAVSQLFAIRALPPDQWANLT